MNPVAQEAIGSILRWVLAILAGFFVQHGIWSATDAEKYVATAAMALIALGWSLWQKYGMRTKLHVALISPPGTTEEQVEQKIAVAKDMGTALPVMTTPKDAVPVPAPPIQK